MPLPEGEAHVPSPRQNVVGPAPVPLARLFTDKLPVTPEARGKPVALVNVTDDGVPNAGVTSVGLALRTT